MRRTGRRLRSEKAALEFTVLEASISRDAKVLGVAMSGRLEWRSRVREGSVGQVTYIHTKVALGTGRSWMG